MIRGFLLRAAALAALAGQLQLLPAGIACAAAHDRPGAGHCDDGVQGAGVAVRASQDAPAAPLCALGIGCTASSGLASARIAQGVAADVFVLPASAVPAPASLHLTPTPPPPQV